MKLKTPGIWLLCLLLFFITVLVFIQYLKLYPLESFQTDSQTSSKIPNQIWTFWDGEVPDIIDKCMSSWKKNNPTYSIILLNKNNLSLYLDPQEIEILNHANLNDSPQRFSDAVRLTVLSKYGGFWIDASIICNRSFDWIHEIQKNEQVELVGYYFDGFTLENYKNHSPVIENWFFGCIPNSPFVKEWCNEFLSISKYNSIDDYLKHIEEKEINTQNIDGKNYLAMHVSAQKVLQSAPPNHYSLYLLKAEDTAFEYLIDNNWQQEKAINRVLNFEYQHQPILKMRGGERDIMKKMNYQPYFETI